MNNRMARLLGVLPAVLMALAVALPATAQTALDDYGYNHAAKNILGTGDSWDRTLDGTYEGDPTYANDRLTVRWNAEWARGMQEQWSDPDGYAGAWLSNQWNGNTPGGSGELASYKFSWVGDCTVGEAIAGAGTCTRDQFAVIVDSNEHETATGATNLPTHAAFYIQGLG